MQSHTHTPTHTMFLPLADSFLVLMILAAYSCPVHSLTHLRTTEKAPLWNTSKKKKKTVVTREEESTQQSPELQKNHPDGKCLKCFVKMIWIFWGALKYTRARTSTSGAANTLESAATFSASVSGHRVLVRGERRVQDSHIFKQK